jgi:D-methionine transport system permease protein
MRALPFVILMIAVLPLTKWLVGRTIGTVAACVPLTLTAIPFMARVVENACAGVHPGLIEAGQSMGATPRQIVWRIVVPESQISILNGIILMLIALIGYSAMAGTLAGGGLGALAFNYGYQRFRNDIMLMTVLCMVVLVQGVQWLGDRWVSRLKVARQ